MSLVPTMPQAVVVRGADGPRVVARSPGFGFALEEFALRTAIRFGPRPVGVACRGAVFAVPADRDRVAVVHAADRGDGPAAPLLFRFVVHDRRFYEAINDPFRLAEHYPPDWSAVGTLPDLDWSTEVAPVARTVSDVQGILKGGDSTVFLGAAQALIDGGRVAIQRDAPDPEFVRGLWQLLPARVRAELWPATFAFAAELGFHLVALPAPTPVGYLGEEQAKDYPEGRYELSLQTAAEGGDQAELDRLFARKTSREVLRLALAMVAFALLVAAVLKFL